MEKNKNEKLDKIVIILAIIVIVVLVLFGIFKVLTSIDFNTSKEDSNKNTISSNENTVQEVDENKIYVYEKNSYNIAEGIDIKIPYINIISSDIEELNNKLLKEYNDAVEKVDIDKNGNGSYKDINYEFSVIDNKILSLKVDTSDCVIPGGGSVINRKVYNIDLSSGKILSIDEVLTKIGLNKEAIENSVEDRLKEVYNNSDYLKSIYTSEKAYIKNFKYDFDTIYFNSSKIITIINSSISDNEGQEVKVNIKNSI